jgi:hypothetical protein
MMASPLETLRALARTASPSYEKNERNEISRSAEQAQDYERNERNEQSHLLSFNSFISLPGSADDPEERAALIAEGSDVPKTWAEGFAALVTTPAPDGFSSARWQRIIDATGKFLDRWAETAIACGWSDLDVFGCDPDRPDARFDAMGLVLLLDRCEVVGIDEAGADLLTATGARQRYRRRTLPAGTVSLWQLAMASGAA